MVALATLVARGTPGQQVIDPPGVRRGQVVNEANAPIAGARVRVDVAATVQTPCREHTLDVLARWPLRGITTDAEGRFALALTPAHLRLGTGLEPPLTLVVEAEGYQPWYEPLPFGLTGFLGTRVVLRPTDADAVCAVEIEAPPPWTMLWVRRTDAPDGLGEERVFDVPADGAVVLSAPLLPTPLLFDDWRRTRALGYEVQLWAPGRSAASRLDLRRRQLRFAVRDTATRRVRVLAEGRPAAGLRGLYACPDGSQRWFGLADGDAPEDPHLRLLAVTAPMCATALVSGALDDIVLAPLTHRDIALELRSRGGEPVRRAEAWLVPVLRWPPAVGPQSGARSLAVGTDGRAHADLADLQQAWLCVLASAHWPLLQPPSNATTVPNTLLLTPTDAGPGFVTVLDEGGVPAPGTEVRLVGSGQSVPAPVSRLLCTDGAGTCMLPLCVPGSQELVCVSDDGYCRSDLGNASAEGRLRAQRLRLERARRLQQAVEQRVPPEQAVVGWRAVGETGEKALAAAAGTFVLAGRALRARVVTRNDQPAAFVSVSIDSETADGERRTRHGCTDSLGRVHAAYVGDAATLSAGDVSTEQRAVAGVDPRPLELVVPEQRPLVVALPAGAHVQRVSFWMLDGGVRHENLDIDADHLAIAWRQGCHRCDIRLAEGPPATILAADVDAARSPLPLLVRDRIVRRVPVHAFDPEQRPVRDFDVRPAFGNASLLVYDQREANGIPAGIWTARDEAPCEVQVFHPAFLPSATLAVPAAQGGRDAALIVPLVPGASVRFRLAKRILPASAGHVTVTISDGGRPRYHVTLAVPSQRGDTHTEVALPFALPPGQYAFSLTGVRGTFVVADTSPVTVTCDR